MRIGRSSLHVWNKTIGRSVNVESSKILDVLTHLNDISNPIAIEGTMVRANGFCRLSSKNIVNVVPIQNPPSCLTAFRSVSCRFSITHKLT